MRVLHVYRCYYPDPPGGMQEAIRQICLATQKQGVENTVFTLSPSAEPKNLSRPEAIVNREKSWFAPASCDFGSFAALRTYRRLAAEVDVVHYYFPWPYMDLLHKLKPDRTPSVLTYVSDIVRQKIVMPLYRPLMFQTLRSVDAIVTNAPNYAASSQVMQLQEFREKSTTIPLTIDEETSPLKENTEIFAKLGIDRSSPYFLFVGAFRRYKGLHTLVETAATVAAPIVLAGSGAQRSVLERKTKELGAHNVLFAGRVSEEEKLALIRHCRAFVLPSHLRSEAFGMVLIEASMQSKPMITCEIQTGTSYINKHQETGLVVPPDSPGAFGDAMNKMLLDGEFARRTGLAARQRYENLFSPQKMGKAYTELFRSVSREGQIPYKK